MIISVWTFVIFDTAIDLRTGHGDRFYWTITKTDKARLVCNPAYQLYRDPIYRRLAGFDLKNLYILSAGWGMIKADFLTPNYDITFSQTKPKDK